MLVTCTANAALFFFFFFCMHNGHDFLIYQLYRQIINKDDYYEDKYQLRRIDRKRGDGETVPRSENDPRIYSTYCVSKHENIQQIVKIGIKFKYVFIICLNP